MKYLYILLAVATLLVTSCSEKELGEISPSNGKPKMPTVLKIDNIAGGTIISYELPPDDDVLGIKCVYTISNGKKYETTASYFDNKLKIEGFIDMKEYEAMLYTINRGQELSDPVSVKFTPLKSPIAKVAETMNFSADFGGLKYSWQNPDSAFIDLEFLTPDSLGIMQTAKIYPSKAKEGLYNLRGYRSEPRIFGVIVRDRFRNASDTIFPLNPITGERVMVVPWFETKLDKKKVLIMGLSNDSEWNAFGEQAAYMLDDKLETFCHSPQNSIPAAVTFDLGQKVKLSRVTIHQRKHMDHYYNWGNPILFDIYNCAHEPSRSGNWDEWTLIQNCEIIKPSRLPVNQETEEDVTMAKEGHNFNFSPDMAALRYLRLNFTRTWTNLPTVHFAEITFYGDNNVEQ